VARCQADLFHVSLAAVVPQQPAVGGFVEDGERFVAAVVVPAVRGRADDRMEEIRDE
jgi:hypothetical protein